MLCIMFIKKAVLATLTCKQVEYNKQSFNDWLKTNKPN